MGNWLQMEKRRSIKLVSLLIQYTFCFLFAVILFAVMGIAVFDIAMNKGFILPANTAEIEAKESIRKLKEQGRFDKKLISPRCEYVLFSDNGTVKETSLNKEFLTYAKKYFLYGVNEGSRYHLSVVLGSTTCVLQYSFRINYTRDELNQRLPNFQFLCIIGIFLCVVMVFLVLTIYFAKKIKKQLEPLMLSVQQLATRDLDKEFKSSKIKEFDEVLFAMDKLRVELKNSMIEKWKMEQDRSIQTAALLHDIKTPLTVISGNAELLEESANTDEQIICSNAIKKNVYQTECYMEKLRQLAQSEQSITPQKEIIDGRRLIERLKKSSQDICKIRKTSLVFETGEVGPCYIDEEAIVRCVLNIVENACRFTKEGNRITIEIKETGLYLQIIVIDFGPGFSKEALQHATDLFYTENGNRNPMGHSGIGLSYVKKVVELHEGKLILENTSNGHGKVAVTIKKVKNE